MLKQEYIARPLVCLFFLLIWLRYILGETILLFLLPVVGVFILLVYYRIFISAKKVLAIAFFWFFLFFLFSLLSSLRSNFYSIYFVLLGFSGFVVAFVLFIDKKFSYYLSGFLFYSFFLFAVAVVLTDSRPAYDSLNDMFPDASRNIVGAIAVFLLSFNMLSVYRVKNSIPLMPFLCSCALVVLAYGRSSMMTLAILSLPYLYFYFKRYVFAFCLLLFVLLFTAAFFEFDYDSYFISFTKSGLDSPRTQMYAEYWGSLDLMNFIFGESVFESPTIASYDGNSHSSYIRSHSYYGVLIMLFMGFCFFLLIVNGKINFVVFGVLVSYLFRVSFEQIAFFDVFDFLFFYCMLFLSCGVTAQVPPRTEVLLRVGGTG